MSKTFVLSDESVNSYGYWVLSSGIDLTAFKNNPVMLWMHNRAWRGKRDDVLPIGRWENIRLEDGKLLADAVFDEEDEFALSIKNKVEGGFLKMASIGITPTAWEEDVKLLKPGQTRPTVTKSKMKEASIVDIGSNENALALYDDNGNIYELSDGSYPIPLLNQKQYKKMSKIHDVLKLAHEASDDAVVEEIQLLQKEKNEADKKLSDAQAKVIDLQGKLKAKEDAEALAKKAEAETLTHEAIKDGRLNADAKDSTLQLFAQNHEAAKAMLAGIPKRSKVSDKLADTADNSEFAKLEKLTYSEMDRQGLIKTLKRHPELYKQKFKEQFGKDPK